MTRDQLDYLVRRLSNQCWVRYFIRLRPGKVLLSLVEVTDDIGHRPRATPGNAITSEMQKYGFSRLEENSTLPGQVWIGDYGDACTHDRLNEDGICRACGADCRGGS